jgi:hypothetical protein
MVLPLELLLSLHFEVVLLCRPLTYLRIDLVAEDIPAALQLALPELQLTTHIVAVQQVENYLPLLLGIDFLLPSCQIHYQRVEVMMFRAVQHDNVLAITLVLLALLAPLPRVVNERDVTPFRLEILQASERLVQPH